jgi:two-component system cell cycle sensor histidine kinase/response regulator CckA
MTGILLVEDDRKVRQLIGEMLRRRGYQVVEAGSGHEAVSLVEQDPLALDLLVADVVMPRMSGRELAGIVSSLRPGIKVLYISGYPDDQLRQHGVSPLEANLLQKPFTQEELIRKVEELLRDEPKALRAGGAETHRL